MNEMRKAPIEPGSKILILELGRFVAASLVVLTHLLPQVNNCAAHGVRGLFAGWNPPGALAVQYFFVLSGFVMMSAHAKDFGKSGAVLRFWWRRACRIYPVYWLALLIPIYYLHNALTPLLSFQLFSLAPGVQVNFIPPAWTLRYEVAFYLVFGLCLSPKIGKPLLLLWVFCTFWGWATPGMLHFLHLPAPVYLDELLWGWKLVFISCFNMYFFAGLAVGWIFKTCCPNRLFSLLLILCGGAMLFYHMPALDWGNGYGNPAMMMMTAPVLAMILLGLVGVERSGWLKLSPRFSFLGAMSYPLYILHTALLLVVGITLPKLHLNRLGLSIYLVVALAIVYGVAVLVTRYFDQPVQHFLRRLGNFKISANSGAVSK